MKARRRRHFYLKYCFQKQRLIVKSESVFYRKAADFLLDIKESTLNAFRRGYVTLLATDLPPQSFNINSDDSDTDEFTVSSTMTESINDSNSGYDFIGDLRTDFLSNNLFDDDPVRGMWDITSVYYSMMHMDDGTDFRSPHDDHSIL